MNEEAKLSLLFYGLSLLMATTAMLLTSYLPENVLLLVGVATGIFSVILLYAGFYEGDELIAVSGIALTLFSAVLLASWFLLTFFP